MFTPGRHCSEKSEPPKRILHEDRMCDKVRFEEAGDRRSVRVDGKQRAAVVGHPDAPRLL